MIASLTPLTRAQARLSIAVVFLALVQAGSARGQQAVINGDFAKPVVSAPDGALTAPSPGDGWSYPQVAGGGSGITVEENASGFNAPKPPHGAQMGWVGNLGEIRQSINLTTSNYTLSFELARRNFGCSGGVCNSAPPPLAVAVKIGDQKFGPYTPTSDTSFNKVTVPFQILAGGPQILSFSGIGSAFVAGQDDHTTFITSVSVEPAPGPVITFGPSDIDPTSSILLYGAGFGATGKIKVHFPDQVIIANSSKSEITLDASQFALEPMTTGPIDTAFPLGKADPQNVDISFTTADGKLTSNVLHAKFNAVPVITSVVPPLVMPGQSFLLLGWDFDSAEQCKNEKTGTVRVHFTDKTFPHSDLVLPIPRSGCTPNVIKITLPTDISGVIAQPVAITYESPHGRKSSPWPAQFVPKIETKVLPWQNVVVVTCSNQSAFDACNNPNASGSCWSAGINTVGSVPGPPTDSIFAQHNGCWGISSDDGTDIYQAAVSNGWGISPEVAFFGYEDNASLSDFVVPPSSSLPFPFLVVSVSWHIGATGGLIDYGADINIIGPTGVPFE